jgi:hypothetical protein
VGNDDQLSLHYFGLAPDLPHPVGDDAALAGAFQQLPESGLCLVEAEWTSGPQSVPMPRMILKSRQEGSGMTYLGSMIVAFARCSWVIKIQNIETGVTGVREAIWTDQYFKNGGTVEGLFAMGWSDRPSTGPRRLPSDDEEWDALVPQHPLSRVRRHLTHIRSGLELSPDTQRLAPFQ